MTSVSAPHPSTEPLSPGPPGWLIGATAALAIGTLTLAVAETNLWMHYLIDAGESISLIGLAFVVGAGLFLYKQRRLAASVPFALPWLLFPVITQGDQIIDNLSINWMRLVSHLLLGLLFGAPVSVIVLAVLYAIRRRDAAHSRPLPRWSAVLPGLRQMAEGRSREGCAILAALLLAAEMWVAVQFLGALMVVTLIVMIWGVLIYGFSGRAPTGGTGGRSERLALAMLLIGAAASLGLFVGFKNRPGAYQGSPSYYLDPSQGDVWFRLDTVRVPSQPVALPADGRALTAALTGYGRAFQRLLEGYYILDRNYNYHFHNELFLRSTPLLPSYREAGLTKVRQAQALRVEADEAATVARAGLPTENPLRALLDDVEAYAAFTFGRAPLLESMSARFERTPAGLQHATHLYEGEGKVLGLRLADILAKHQAVLSSPMVSPLTAEFVTTSRAVHDAYANRVVGF